MTHRERTKGDTDRDINGYDAREWWRDFRFVWSESRRSEFLLRSDVHKPLSVDPMVWPSVFDVGGGCGLPKDEREEMGLTGLPLPEWVGERHPLWGDLPELMGHLARSGNIRGEYRLVAITPVRSGGVIPPPTTALGASVEFSMLGFDVADEWLLSGLMNCGYINAERADLAKEFGSHLNKWHLFHDLNAAHAFQTITDQRVPEHAPFFVYALWAAAGRLPPEAAENWEADVDPGANRGGL